MPKLIGAVLAKNEGSTERFLRPVMVRLSQLCDRVIVLDDQSIDDTAEICEGFGAIVHRRAEGTPKAWGSEAAARAELFDLARQECERRDWIVVCDADMILSGDPRPLMGTRDHNAIAWRLYDVWGDRVYRSDNFWVGHLYPRVWMCRPHSQPEGWQPQWHRDGLHVGHIPTNFAMFPLVAPEDVFWLHMGYSKPSLRQQAHKRYLEKAHLLGEHELAHANSILDETP